MSLSEQQLRCSRPFEWFEVHPDGSVFLCCPAWLKRPIGNLLKEPVDEIWNGAVAQEIRKSILNGSFHNCSHNSCPYLMSRTKPICCPDQLTDRQVREAVSSSRSTLPYRPRQLNLCFDHSCNLACPSCRHQIELATGADLERVEQISMILQKELIPHTHSITLSGFGDPFGSPTYLSLLKQINRRDYPQLKQVRLHTNGQLLDETMWENLPELQTLVSEIEISVDAATEQTYRLNRPCGSFRRLQQNLEFLCSTDCELTLSMVVQQNNWREISQFVALAQRFQAKTYLSQLVNWGTFTREEFRRRAVHLPGHPENEVFRKRLAETAQKGQVELGNLCRLLFAG